MRLTDATLTAWLSGALEPPRALEVEEALRRDPLLHGRLTALRAAMDVTPGDPWRIPPPGIPGGRVGFGMGWHQAAVFGGPLRPGDRFELRLDALSDASERFVVVLRQLVGRWRVVFPTDPLDTVRLADLPQADGQRILEVSAGPEPGAQRWAVALPTLGTAVDWVGDEAARWAEVMRAMAAGEVPVASAEITVGDRR